MSELACQVGYFRYGVSPTKLRHPMAALLTLAQIGLASHLSTFTCFHQIPMFSPAFKS